MNNFNPKLRPRIKKLSGLMVGKRFYYYPHQKIVSNDIPEGSIVQVTSEVSGSNLTNRTLSVMYNRKEYTILLIDLQRR